MGFILGASAVVLGASTLCSFGAGGCGGTELKVTNNISTRMAINSYTGTTNKCNTESFFSNSIEIEGKDGFPTEDENKGATACRDLIEAYREARAELELDAKARNRRYQIQTEVGQAPLIEECEHVVGDPNYIQAINQSINFEINQGCEFQTNSRSDAEQKLKGNIDQYLENKNDVFGELSSVFNSLKASTSNSISKTMSASVTNVFGNNVNLSVNGTNNVTAKGNSMYMTNIIQRLDGSAVSRFSQSNKVLNRISQSSTYAIGQSLVHHNDTLGDVTTSLSRILTSMAQLLEETIGAIVVAIGAVLLGVLMVFSTMYLFNKTFRSYVDERVDQGVNRMTSGGKAREEELRGLPPSS